MALSDDLRKRVVEAVVLGGLSRNQAAAHFKVSVANGMLGGSRKRRHHSKPGPRLVQAGRRRSIRKLIWDNAAREGRLYL